MPTGSVPAWPEGKKVAVKICVALESWAEYGATTGVWRLLEALDRHDMRATFGVSGLLAERHPEPVLAAHTAGHEIAAHSYAQDIIPGRLGLDEERANLMRCTEILRQVTGSRPVGWLSPRATASRNTPDLLAAAGYRWSGDHNDRDLPYVTTTSAGPLAYLMHSDFTDVRGVLAGPRAYRDVHVDLLHYLLRQPTPGILNLTVHAHVGGRPLFADQFEQVLQQIARVRDDVWIATHRELADQVLAS
ncbi:polysaccharide deacetylase family protein [Amycolatopsis sp. WGS_07]|uniref:polysaccharide deacetylase family protein n=1 Tax=Amycolatopsis sp. WGS_07 TaxID=3076764 RepID=UPI0038737BFE